MTDHFQESSSILENLYLVDVRVGFPCGTVSGSDDLVQTSEKDVVRVGVQIFDPKLNRPFSKARQQVRRLCTSLGSQFLGGYAIPDAHIEEFRREVTEVSSQFQTDQDAFLDQLDQSCLSWADAHPDLRAVILANRPSREAALKAFKFGVRMCKVMPPEPGTAADTQDNYLYEEVRGLGLQIAREIAQDVKDSWGGDLGTGKTTQKVVGLIRRCRKKAYGLAFVHPKVQSLVGIIDQVLADLPATGPIDGVQYLKVTALLRMLSDVHQIVGDQQVIVPEPEEAAPEQQQPATPSDEDIEDESPSMVEHIPPAVKQQPASLRVGWMF